MRLGTAVACTAVPETALAQVTATGAAVVSFVEHRVDAGYGVERSSGMVAGAGAGMSVGGRFDLDVTARGGSLTARTPETLDRDMGELSVEAGVKVLSWLALRGGAARRAYTTDIGRQRWTTVNIGAEGRQAVAGTAAAGVIRVAWLPVVDVNGLDQPHLALTTAAGVEYRYGAFSGGLFYELERCDFPPQGSVRRREQVSALTLRIALRSTRRP